MSRLLRETFQNTNKQAIRRITQDDRFQRMVKRVEESATTYGTNGIFPVLKFLREFSVKPSPTTVQSLTTHAAAMLEHASDKDVVSCLTALASFGPVEATKQILPELEKRIRKADILDMSLGTLVAICTSFARLGYNPDEDFQKVVMEGATPRLSYLKPYQALPFLTTLRVDVQTNAGKNFIAAYSQEVASRLVEKIHFDVLPELLNKYTEISDYKPDDHFIQVLDKIATTAAPKLDEWNSGQIQRCVRAFHHFHYYPPREILEAFRHRTERLLLFEWASGKNAVALTTYFGRLSCRLPGGFDPPGFPNTAA